MRKTINYVNECQLTILSDMNSPQHNRIELCSLAHLCNQTKFSVLIWSIVGRLHQNDEWLSSLFKYKVSNFVFRFFISFFFPSIEQLFQLWTYLTYFVFLLHYAFALEIWLVIFATMHKISISKLSTMFLSLCVCVLTLHSIESNRRICTANIYLTTNLNQILYWMEFAQT